MKLIFNVVCVLILLSSCFKEEDARPNTVSSVTIPMGNNYEEQFFFSLEQNKVISSNAYNDWFLALSNNAESYIRLNGACNMWVYKTGSFYFNEVYSTANYTEEDRRFDGSHGRNNDLAIDQFIGNQTSTDTLFTNKEVYIIDLGSDALGNSFGSPKKFQWLGMFDDAYIIRFADLDGNNEQLLSIPKYGNTNYLYVNLLDAEIKTIEPDKTTWDLLFTRSTDTAWSTDGTEFLVGYAVTGAYLNEYQTEAYVQESISYDDFTLQNVSSSLFSNYISAIGHDWKKFSDQYFIFKDKVYIVRTQNQIDFKLRFLNFYNDLGEKGYPSIQFEAL